MRTHLVALWVIALTSISVAQPSPLETVIASPYPIQAESGSPNMVKSRIAIISRVARILTGFEDAGEPAADSAPRETVELRGLTVREALNELIRLDPRFTWREVAGVLVVRPKAAWTDCRHYLHREVSFEQESLTLATAPRALLTLIDPTFRQTRRDRPMPGLPGAHEAFAVAVSKGTIMSVLNATAQAGQMFWSIGYGATNEDGARWIEMSFERLAGGRTGWGGMLRPMAAPCPP